MIASVRRPGTWRVLVRAVLALGAVLLVACEAVAPQPPLTVTLRDDNNTLATCTGSPMPSEEACRGEGEGALNELARPGIRVAGVEVLFGPVAVGGCRTVTWTVLYDAGVRESLASEQCNAAP